MPIATTRPARPVRRPQEDFHAQAEPLRAHLPRQYDQHVEHQDQPDRPKIALEAQQTDDRHSAPGRNAEERKSRILAHLPRYV